MTLQKIVQSRAMALVPLVLVGVFIASYIVSQSRFIECDPQYPKPGISDPNTPLDCTKAENADRCTSAAGCKMIDPRLVINTVENPFQKEPDWHKGPKQDQLKAKEILAKRYSGRFVWMFFTSAALLVSLGALVVFGIIASRWVGWWMPGLLVLAIVVGSWAAYRDSMPVAQPLFENTIVNGVGGIGAVIDTGRFINAVGYTASFAMILAIMAVLFKTTPRATPAKPKPKDQEYIDEFDFKPEKEKPLSKTDSGRRETLLDQMTHLRVILYTSTALLIVGLLRLSSGFTWTLSFMTEETAKISEGLLANVTTVLGGFFTILLACTYLPAVFIIWKRAEGEDMAEMEKKGFKFSFGDSLPKILAIAAPLLTGPIAELLKNLVPK